jgi:hypothetical protein
MTGTEKMSSRALGEDIKEATWNQTFALFYYEKPLESFKQRRDEFIVLTDLLCLWVLKADCSTCVGAC